MASPIVEELWLVTENGDPLFEYCKEAPVDKSLITSFSKAILTFSKEATGQEMTSFDMGEYTYHMTSCIDPKVILLTRSSKSVKSKNIEKTCKVIIDMFLQLHKNDDVETLKNDPSKLAAFKQKLDIYFKMSNL